MGENTHILDITQLEKDNSYELLIPMNSFDAL